MTWLDISPDAVLHEVRAGKTTRGELASHFGVLLSSAFLRDAIEALVADGRLTERGEHLVPHELVKGLRLTATWRNCERH